MVVVRTGQEDFTYYLAPQSILTCLEVQIGIINACLPTLKPLFDRKPANNASTFKAGSTTAGVSDSNAGSEHIPLTNRRLGRLDEEQLMNIGASASTVAALALSSKPGEQRV